MTHGLDAEAWAVAFTLETACDVPLDDLRDWFRSALQAGYDAAREFDPNMIYVEVV